MRDHDVRIVKLPPRRPRYEVLTTGEELRELFEQRLDAREPESTWDHAKAGPREPASRRCPGDLEACEPRPAQVAERQPEPEGQDDRADPHRQRVVPLER